MVQIEESLRRAEREYAIAVARGDAESASLIAQAIQVLELARDGQLPAQRLPSE